MRRLCKNKLGVELHTLREIRQRSYAPAVHSECVCGRYTVTASASRVAERFGVSVPECYRPRYNCAPGQHLPIVAEGDTLRMAEWNFPHPSGDETYINARRETITTRSAFADAFERRRCLVPADGFYVWRAENGERRPYRVAFPDDRLFAMAGIYAEWTDETRQAGLGEFASGGPPSDAATDRCAFAVVTAPAPGWLREYHHRGDVILRPADESEWVTDADGARAALDTSLPSALTVTPASTRVNDVRNDDPNVSCVDSHHDSRREI